jgi:predicted PurR-regulated permease PerM
MSFFTWSTLLTVSGAAAATAYIVQFLKNFSAIKKVNSQLVAFIVALVVMSAAMYFNGTLTADSIAMLPISAIIVCFAANGAYDSVAKSVSTVTSSVESIVSEITSSLTSVFSQVKTAIESIGTYTETATAATDTATDTTAAATTTANSTTDTTTAATATDTVAAQDTTDTTQAATPTTVQ